MHKVMGPFSPCNKSTGMTNTGSKSPLAAFIFLIMCLMLSGCSAANKYVEIILVDTSPAPVCTPVPEISSPSSAVVPDTPYAGSASSAKPDKPDNRQEPIKDKHTNASQTPSSEIIPTPTAVPADESSALAWPDSSPSPIPTATPSVTATPAPAALPSPTPGATLAPIPKATPKSVSKIDEIPSQPQDIVPKAPAEAIVYSSLDSAVLRELHAAYDTYMSRYVAAYADFETLCNPVIELMKLMGELTDDPEYIAELNRLKDMLYEYAEQFCQDVCVLDNQYFSEVKAILEKHGLQVG